MHSKITKPAEEVSCLICYGTFFNEELFGLQTCNHMFCRGCVSEYLETKISGNEVINIHCPMSGCTEELTDDLVIELTTHEIGQKFRKFKYKLIMGKDPEARPCSKADCELYVKRSAPDQKKLLCDCGQLTCFDCATPWHEGAPCNNQADDEFKKFMERAGYKPCPSCKRPCEKIKGCDRMQCSQCQFIWCWACGQHYGPNHFNIFDPFVCAGLKNQRPKTPCLRLILWNIWLLFWLLIAVVIVPPIIYFAIALEFAAWYNRKYWKTNHSKMRKIIHIFANFVMFVVGLLCAPFIMLISSVYHLCHYAHLLYVKLTKGCGKRKKVPPAEPYHGLSTNTTSMINSHPLPQPALVDEIMLEIKVETAKPENAGVHAQNCLLYTSPSPRDGLLSRMPSSA
eukprot:TRINITY_DN6970_c0_g1_i3.p2 TRINITY_DN6970_c0_g1~~TRINITY_DN6970_c0_g1_i3.p2  ORF type:complete len:397 (+),score=-8.08 TRINITY_DN6970_c0_g1_i3:286-1476(+)